MKIDNFDFDQINRVEPVKNISRTGIRVDNPYGKTFQEYLDEARLFAKQSVQTSEKVSEKPRDNEEQRIVDLTALSQSQAVLNYFLMKSSKKDEKKK